MSGYVQVDGRIEKAHLTNTGRLHELLYAGAKVLLIPSNGKKTKWRIVAVPIEKGWASVIDTRIQEEAVRIAITKQKIPAYAKWHIVKRHPRCAETLRFDFLLQKEGKHMWLEVKSAVYFFPEDQTARYPDTISLRGRKHWQYALEGNEKVSFLFVVGDPRASAFRPSEDDPILAELIRKAAASGIPIHAIQIALEQNQIVLLNAQLPVRLG